MVFLSKRDNTDYAHDTTSSVTIEGDIDSVVTHDKDLGTIKTGEQSQLDVIATISDGDRAVRT